MFRPERMSRVSVTGSKAVMPDVVEALHDLDLVHLSDYEGDWEGFENGDPMVGAESASDRLVTVRSLKSILGVTGEHAGPTRIVTDESLDEQLDAVRAEVNELDDRRADLRDELRSVEERIDAVEPFADLGIDLDLLWGYDHLDVAVGEGDADEIERALADAAGVRAYEVFSGDRNAVAAVVYPADGAEDPLEEALVGADFTRVEIPDAEGSPEEHVADLEHRCQRLESQLSSVENELGDLRLEHAGFLLAVEEKLTIDVQKTEAPLQFATTEHAFVAEGWIPTDDYTLFSAAVGDAVGDRVDVEELERASYTPTHGHESEHVAEHDAMATDGGATTDGHDVRMGEDTPPVVQDNPSSSEPFELLVETINRPRYFELDPTVVLFLTFPLFYGFMIGDLGYGLLYMGLGYALYSRFDSAALESLGGIAMWAGGFTALFGILYGEFLGFHWIAQHFWVPVVGLEHAPIEKGLHGAEFAQLWLTLSVLVGILHLGTGYVFGFANDVKAHGTREAVLENGSWLLAMIGVWAWIFSTSASDSKPAFLVGSESVFNGHPVPLGFTGFPELVGLAGLALALVGVAMAMAAEGVAIGLLEFPTNALVNVISYTRIAAVLLAKAGMAFVVNLLVFGAYQHHEEIHFTTGFGAQHAPEGAEVLFGGLAHGGVAGILGGLVVLFLGHILVLALGVTSAGLQAVRLEYVEFFGKFYEGGGEKYQPFGHRRTYTTED